MVVRYTLILLLILLNNPILFAAPLERMREEVESGAITLLPNIGEFNQVPLVNNRFRIDHEVDSVTLLFFRQKGSASVVLVQPNGKKIYVTQAVVGQVDWYDDATYDLIRITNPMPGPWQAVGKLEKNSSVMVITDIELDTDPLPEIIIQNETIKTTARLMNGNQPIDAQNFRDVISLDIFFHSSNDSEYNNFGASSVKLATFKDDGKNFDGRPKDGEFTGEYKLDFADGEWIPKYSLESPLFRRVIELNPIIVHKNPITMSINKTDDITGYHQLTIDIVGNYVKAKSFIFQGRITYPSGDIQSFSITEPIEESRKFNIKYTEPGTYQITLKAFGENTNGREIMLDVPAFNFIVEATFEQAQGSLSSDELEVINTYTEAVEEPINTVPPKNNTLLFIMIFIGNGLLLLIGYLAIRVLVQGKSLSFKFLAKLNPWPLIKSIKQKIGQKKPEEELELPSENSGLEGEKGNTVGDDDDDFDLLDDTQRR